MNRIFFTAFLGAALLAAAAPSEARAPSAADRGGMDWLLRSLQADREVDAKGPAVDPVVAKIEAYSRGDPSAPFEEWMGVADVVKDPKGKLGLRDKAVSALMDRVRLEIERKAELKVVGRVRIDICKYLLRMIIADDLDSRTMVKRILDGLMPGNGVDWKADDNLQKRGAAYKELQKKLR
jgi:hypothetical protein